MMYVRIHMPFCDINILTPSLPDISNVKGSLSSHPNCDPFNSILFGFENILVGDPREART